MPILATLAKMRGKLTRGTPGDESSEIDPYPPELLTSPSQAGLTMWS